MSKPGIPAIPLGPPDVHSFHRALKENLELLTGIRGGTIDILTPTATLDDVIAKLNEVIVRINAR